MKRAFIALLASIALSLAAAGGAQANHSFTDVVSTGANGGNGAFPAVFRASSTDGTRVFIQTSEQLVAADTDAAIDLYERSNGATTQVSTSPTAGNGPNSATYAGSSQDGTRVFFRTTEALVPTDTDNAQDLYERFGGVTTRISVGAIGGNANLPAVFSGASNDGTYVFFQTAEALDPADTDTGTDVYQRFAGTTTRVSTGAIGGNSGTPASFAGATPDGSHVYFHTDESLAGSDTDDYQDLYQRAGGVTTHLSIGPVGGNGNDDFDYDSFFDGVSADGSKVWLHTDEVLVGADTDTAFDIYERQGANISLVSTGPGGGNAAIGAFFDGASADGSRVYFDTQEPMLAADTDASSDIYERSGGSTTQVSTGPGGGNGDFYSSFASVTPDGSHVFFSTPESLVAADTDTFQDVYDRSGGTTTLVSVGPDGGNNANPASFLAASKDGSRVFFSTDETLIGTDTDLFPDIYERRAGQTTWISTGAIGGTGEFFSFWAGMADDGSRVFFETDEPLVAADTDLANDVYQASVSTTGYPRPKGAAQIYASLVPAYRSCTTPNRTHAPTWSFGSCNPPLLSSSQLTVGSPDVNGKAANAVGSVKLNVIPGIANTPADEADVRITVSFTDVRKQSDLSDYAGELQVRQTMRVTDKVSGSVPIDPATVMDLPYVVTVPCTPTGLAGDLTLGSTCSTLTTADALLPGTVLEIKRTIWQIGQVEVWDGGPDGVAATTAGNTLFAVQGIFAP